MSFILLFFIFELRQKCDMILPVTVTKCDGDMTFVIVIQSYNIEKSIEVSRTDNIIEYSNNILILWKAHVL